MPSVSIIRNKCYSILQGIERSLAMNLTQDFDVEQGAFLTTEEQERALVRLREDLGEAEWRLEDVRNGDLLLYLDLGDLLGLLNRHKSHAKSIKPSEIRTTTDIAQQGSLHAIRKRVMHAIRPLEPDDLPSLLAMAGQLREYAPSLNWSPLIEGLRVSHSDTGLLDVEIPPYWVEQPAVPHNLPPAEFDDTGFIGRESERQSLKTLLEAERNVLTVVGPGGIGKTALALRVCHDILEDSSTQFDRIVWVSLKTHYLTADGVQSVIDAVDTTDSLVDRLLGATRSPSDNSPDEVDTPTWDKVLDQLRSTKTLLVIDNLETLGSQIRELAIHMPRESKLLLTSRVGLGEIELRYEMPNLSTKDAIKLMRNIGLAYNYESIARADQALLKKYCDRLHHNPLLIKWFVQAVGKGVRPETILANANNDLDQALTFCWENVYDQLSRLPRDIIGTLLAAKRGLSRAQLQEMLQANHIPFVEALQELHRSNIVECITDKDSSERYQVGSLVLDYLSRHHPPSDSVVRKTRAKLQSWQSERDRSALGQNSYRYARDVLFVESADERIAAQHLRRAIGAIGQYVDDERLMIAQDAIARAQELTPTWWEVYRVKAHILERAQRSIYDVERAFEESISFSDNDVNRFHYAVYLMKIREYGRALEQIQLAEARAPENQIALQSTKGEILVRDGRISEGLQAFELVWQNESTLIPLAIRRVHGTQFASALRRNAEQLYHLGNARAADEAALKGIQIANATAEECNWDWKLAEVGVQLMAEVLGRADSSTSAVGQVLTMASSWDSNERFCAACRERRRTQDLIVYSWHLSAAMPGAARRPSDSSSFRYIGKVRLLSPNYGFIASSELGDVHMDRSSLLRPGVWLELQMGQLVQFSIRQESKGPHAVDLELVEEQMSA